jgi:hypothetical protein
MADEETILTRDEVLVLLSAKARAGSVSAAIALERALRLQTEDSEDLDGELEEILRRK